MKTLIILWSLLIGNVMAENKKTFGGKRLTPSVLNRYQKVSKLYNIPLRIVASTGATESLHGYDKRKEAKGNTQGLFHITRGAAQDVANKVLKDKKLASEIGSFSKDKFREHLLSNRDLEDKLAGGYLKMAYDEAEGDPIKTYSIYNAGVGRFNKPAHKIKPLNKQHDKNLKNYTQRYEDSFNHLNEGGEKIQKALSPLERISNIVIPGAEGAEINEENMAKKRIDKFMVGDKTEETPKGITPAEGNIFESISKQMNNQIAKGNVPVPTQEDRESVPEKEMPQDAPVTEKDKERKKMDDGFKDALLYFGPRLGALILGGTEAAELTDKALKGFDETVGKSREAMLKEGEEKEMSPYQKSRIKIQEEKFRREDEEYAREQEGIASKEDSSLLQSIESTEQTLDEFAQIDTALQDDEGLVGAWDYFVKGSKEDMMPGQSDRHAKRSNIRRMMEQLKVDEGLANTAKTKGAISDLEFKILMKPAPKMFHQEKGWRDWIAKRARILSKMHTNLKKGLRAPLEDNKSRQRIESYKRSIDEDRVPQKEQPSSRRVIYKGASYNVDENGNMTRVK